MAPNTTDPPGITWPPKAVRLPYRYNDRTLDDYDPTVSRAAGAALEAAQAFVAGGVANLVYIGPPGAGKTHLAAGIARAMWVQGRADWATRQTVAGAAGYHAAEPPDPWWVNVPELLDGMQRDMAAHDLTNRDAAAAAKRHPGLVVLDDLGRERVSEWTGAVLYVVINARYESMLPTVMTSNLTVAELDANGYGPVLSRLREGGRVIAMDSASDYRTRPR